jgi:hypothetical protein
MPSVCPLISSAKVEMFLTSKPLGRLGLTVSLPLLGRADEVIE